MRKIFLLLSVVTGLALLCSSALAEGTADVALLTLGLHGSPLSADDVPESLSQISSAVDGVNMVTSRAAFIQEQALEPLYRLMRAAATAGEPLYVRQAYRSYADEERRYAQLSGRGQAAQKPGESSYQTGLSVTLVGEDWKSRELTAEFADSGAARWLSDHAAAYGFVLRYPEGKEDVTGWSYEPWHYRYVGVAAAAAMTQQGLCLEELAANSALVAGLDQDIALPEDVYEVDEPEPDMEEGWDEVTEEEPVWTEESPDDAEPQSERKSDHGVPPMRDPSTIDPGDIGPDGDYEISIDELQ